MYRTRPSAFVSRRRGGPRRGRNSTFRKRRRVVKTAKKPSLIKTIGSALYQVFSCLPFVPAPVKAVADVVAHEFGFGTKVTNPSAAVTAIGTPTSLVYFMEISSAAFLMNHPAAAYNYIGKNLTTNYQSCRPITITVTVAPIGNVQDREGFMTVALFPYTGTGSAVRYRSLTALTLIDSDMFAKAPVRKRTPASQPLTLTYNVPRSNAYLHDGLPFNTMNKQSNGVCGVYVYFECINRDSYDDFKPSMFNVDIRLNLKSELLDPFSDTVTIVETPADKHNLIRDLLVDVPFRNFLIDDVGSDGKRRPVHCDGDAFKFSDSRNAFEGVMKEVRLEDFDMVEEFARTDI